MDDDVAALARCVGDVDRFGTELWGRQPFVWRDRGCFTDLLTTEDVETLLRSAGRRPSFRLVRDGQTLPPAASTRPVRIGGTVVDDAADLARITALVGGGATIVLQGLHHLWPPLQRFCGRLERATSHAVQANAYLSPPGAAALRHHRDTHEVLALQVEGSKTWHIDGLGPVTMEAGDVAYLPAGTGHAAAAQDRHSLHVTIGVLATTYAAALQRVVAGACGDLGRPLPLGFARPDHEDVLTDGMARALRAADDHLRSVDPAEVAGAEIGRAKGRARPPARGTLRAAVDPSALGDSVRLRVAAGPLRMTHDGDTVVLEGERRRLRLPAFTAPALQVVLDRGAVDVADLAGLDAPSRVVLARRLVREGFLELDESGRGSPRDLHWGRFGTGARLRAGGGDLYHRSMPDLLSLTVELPERAIAAGEAIIVEGGRTDALYVVVSGAFEVRHGDIVLALVDQPGTCLGELSVLLEQPHHATVVASVPSLVRVAEHGNEFLRGNAEAALLVATILAYRLDVVNGYLADIKAQYSDTAGHLGLIHEVLADLATSKPHAMELGSEREPDPLY